MKSNQRPKLRLHRETIRGLSESEARSVAGGTTGEFNCPPPYTSAPTCPFTCSPSFTCPAPCGSAPCDGVGPTGSFQDP